MIHRFRQAFVLSALVGPSLLSAQQSTQSAGELLPEQRVQHALNRLSFGARPGDAAKVRAMGVEKWIALQLRPEKIDDKAMADALKRFDGINARTEDIARADREAQQMRREMQRSMPDSSQEALRRMAQQNPQFQGRGLEGRVLQDVLGAKMERAVLSERQLYEVMVEFWTNHFSVFVGKGQTRVYLAEYDRDIIRPNAMGNFRALLGAVAKSPAMLFYLDNAQSRADSAHPTLASLQAPGRGRGRPGAQPGQRQQIARFCDGPREPLPPRVGELAPQLDERIKTASPGECVRIMSQFAGQAQRRSGLNENYARELMELHTLGVDGGYTQTDVIEVARALTGWTIEPGRGAFTFNPAFHDAAEKTVLGHSLAAGRGMEDGEQVLDIVANHPATAKFITTKLARRFISDEPPASVVDRCSKVFTKTTGDIRETLACIVKSKEFFDPAAYRAKVKTPFEVVVSAMRATNSRLAFRPGAPRVVEQLGQPIFGRQTPDGWPDVAEEWINTGAILNRINFGSLLAAGRAPGINRGNVPELDAVRNAPRSFQVDAVVRAFFGGEVSPETREILMSGENAFAKAAPDSSMGMSPQGTITLEGLNQIIGLALGAPEFQRR